MSNFYAIIAIERLDEIDFSQVKQTKESVRLVMKDTHFIVEWQGEKPDFIVEKVYSQEEILNLETI